MSSELRDNTVTVSSVLVKGVWMVARLINSIILKIIQVHILSQNSDDEIGTFMMIHDRFYTIKN